MDGREPASPEIESLLAVLGIDQRSQETRRAVAGARGRATSLAEAVPPGQTSGQLATMTFAADLIGSLWLDRRWDTGSIDKAVRRLSELVGLTEDLTRLSLFLRIVRDRHLFELPPRLAIETQLEMLVSFRATTEASLWMHTAKGRLACVLALGAGASSRRARAAARTALAENRVISGERAQLHAMPVRRWNEPHAALVVRSRGETRPRSLAYAAEAALSLGPLLEIEGLLERNVARERSLVESSERRLVRVGFDLHDGPMQDLAALAQDVRLFRSQVEGVLDGRSEAGRMLGRIDDLEARLVSVDRDLRQIARSLQTPTALRLPLLDILESEIDSFRRSSGLAVRFRRAGDLDNLTSSQKIAILRVVQEALANVQEHSGASSVDVRVSGTRAQLVAEVTDDGAGFAVDQRLIEAARAGHLGLVGMGERFRLLGGRLDIVSRPGGPTRIKASVPRWIPVAGDEEALRG